MSVCKLNIIFKLMDTTFSLTIIIVRASSNVNMRFTSGNTESCTSRNELIPGIDAFTHGRLNAPKSKTHETCLCPHCGGRFLAVTYFYAI